MPYPHSLRIEGLLAKEETNYGVDAAPTNLLDGVRGVGRIWGALTHEWAFPNTREDVVSNSLIQVAPAAPRGRVVSIDYTVQLVGAGTAYSSVTPVRPEADPLIRACGFARSHVSTTNVIYDLADTTHASATVWAYAGGKLIKVVGCRGTFTWEALAGGLGQIRFQLQGMLIEAPTEVASPPAITYVSVVPPAAIGAGLALVPSGGSSWTPRVASFTVESGCEIERLDDVNSADGIEGFFIASMAPRMTMAARAADLATYPAYALAAARTVHTVDATLGSTQYNRVKLDVNLAYLENDPGQAADGTHAAWDLSYMLRDLQLDFD